MVKESKGRLAGSRVSGCPVDESAWLVTGVVGDPLELLEFEAAAGACGTGGSK